MPRVGRTVLARTVLGAAAAAAIGVGTGMLGSFLQSAVLDTTPVAVPWGVMAGLLVTALAVTCGVRASGAVGGAAAGLGWFVAVGLLSSTRPEGDLVVTASPLGYVWLVAGALTVLAVLGGHALMFAAAEGAGAAGDLMAGPQD